MKLKPSDLWRLDGTIDRGSYFLWGVLLFAIKFSLDSLMDLALYGKAWSFPSSEHLRLYLWQSVQSKADGPYFLALLAMSLPFLWAGVALTLRRVRSLGWEPWWVLCFFVPVLKLAFFALLFLLPSRAETAAAESKKASGWTDGLGSFVPRSPKASAAVAMVIPAALALVITWIGTTVLRDYGWSLFAGLPFCIGFLSVLLHGFHVRRSMTACLKVANGAVLLAGVGLLFSAMEGIICILMAAPIACLVASAGAAVAYGIQDMFWWRDESPRLFCAAILALPTAMGLEHRAPPPLPLLEVTSSLVVDAPPAKVWSNVVSFSELPPAAELMFKLGVAYPVSAEIDGQGVGAMRHCNFSTGSFIEPIEIWDEPRLLKFSVTRNPAPMKEWTPYRDVHPPHLDGFLESKCGQFRLVPLEGGRTLLEGTTWYHHHMWPVSYWKLWSDYIIHTIHRRVLVHVKRLSEGKAP